MSGCSPHFFYVITQLFSYTRILVYHNHPSSDLTPSEADLVFTQRMMEAGEVLGIELLDHFIVSATKWLSFKEIGLL